MARLTRLIIFDGPNNLLAKQLGKSLPEGINYKGNLKITVINLSDTVSLNGFIETEEKEVKNV